MELIPGAVVAGLSVLFATTIIQKIHRTQHVFLYSTLVVAFFVGIYPFVCFRPNLEVCFFERLVWGLLHGLFVLLLGNLEHISAWIKQRKAKKNIAAPQ